MLYTIAFTTFCSTFFGGIFSIHFHKKIHLIMGFVAGVMLGVVCFDILPEVMDLATKNSFEIIYAMIAMVSGFLVFHLLEKTILIHHAHEGDYATHKHPHVGMLSALALIGHSFMDGVAIGLAFQVNSIIGIAVAIAVIAHDFTDGMNTVTLMLHHKNTVKKAKIFLFLDAIIPAVGIFSTLFFSVPAFFLFLYLGFFAGFILYIGASDILPEAHREKSSFSILGLTVLGSVFIFFVTRVMGV